jgi:flagellar basal-body rod protein FlgB
MSDWGFDSTIGALNTALNMRQMQANVLTTNIAHSETPGFKQKKMEFEQALRDVLEADTSMGSHVRHQARVSGVVSNKDTDPVRPEIFEDPHVVEGLDGNTVNRADQMAQLAENQILFDASIEMLKRKLGMLRYAISEGSGGR